MSESLFKTIIAAVSVLILSFVLGNYTSLTPTLNCNGLFGLESKIIGYIGFVVLLLFVAVAYVSGERSIFYYFFGFVVGGGLHNLIFRIVKGCVEDYYKIGSLYFNFADLSVSIGILGLVCYNFYIYARQKDYTNN